MSFMESILHVKLTSNERLGFPLREQYDKKETQFARLNTFFKRNLSLGPVTHNIFKKEFIKNSAFFLYS